MKRIIRRTLTRIIGFWYNITALFAPNWTAKQLVHVFATPPKPNIRPKEKAFLEKALIDKNTLAEEGGIVYHWGDPTHPYIFMSYGWGYNAGRWRHYVPHLLEANYRVIAYDPPGHGNAKKGLLTLPANASIIQRILDVFGPPEAILAHSFGGGCTIEALASLPEYYHPKRMVVMASFSKATWIFRHFQYMLGLTEVAYRSMVAYMEANIRRKLYDYDLAWRSRLLNRTAGLIVHDPEDHMTHFKNALRYLSFWPNCSLLSADRAGHHLGTPETTKHILAFLVEGIIPEEARRKEKELPGSYDLTRFFAGLDTNYTPGPVRVP